MKIILVIVVAMLLFVSSLSSADSTTVFKGRPILKVSEGGVSRVTESLELSKIVNLKCIISRIGDSYYWASRENTTLLRVDSGTFITYIASNGAGYIRVVNPSMRAAASLMSETEEAFDYVEHALIGLRSVTYYGKIE